MSTQQAANGTCKHYWKIEEANGPTSMGTCQYCGETREFKNSVPVGSWSAASGSTAQDRGLPPRTRMAEDEEDDDE